MAASCNLLQISFPQNPTFPSIICPSRLSNLPLPSRRSLPLCCSSSSSPVRPLVSPSAAVSAIDPALRHANVLYFKSGYNVQIVVDEEEPEEVLLRRFRREVSKAGVIQECKRRRFFENKQEAKKRKAREASRKNRRRRYGSRFNSSTSSSSAYGDSAPKNSREDTDDNWDLPEGDLPY